MSAPSYKYAERHKTMPVCWKLSANLRRFARNLASIDRSIDVFDVLGYKNRWGLRSCPHIPKFNSSDRETESSNMSLKLSLTVLFVAASAVQAFDFFTSGKLLCRHRARKESLSLCLHCNTLVEKTVSLFLCFRRLPAAWPLQRGLHPPRVPLPVGPAVHDLLLRGEQELLRRRVLRLLQLQRGEQRR